ncbi:pyruvate formate-lyase-activating protein [Termitidicoccus mucosus]|uniref:Pyruvate formate-lyase-activating enzyme n=1 Tax=Termitidicoccus mucosus TaxID=1184151 RepID=A0A178IML7_9BACT|nr:pyruvate formate lyase-activating enzyme 1 [Opitutaceae bacterium TSB47]
MHAPPSTLRIHSIETLGTHDGPGLRMIVFTQGCHMRCVYCHNPDTLDLDGGRLVTLDELVERAIRQKPYFGARGGVTISGGEPTVHRRALLALFRRLHAAGIHTCLDTNGLILDEELRALYDETDLVLLDLKHIDDAQHRRVTGVSNANPLAAAAYRESTGRPMWLRYVLVPGWTDQPDALARWATHFAAYKTLRRVEILPYHRLGVHKWEHLKLDYKLRDVEPPSNEIKDRALRIFSAHLQNVVLK